MKIIGITGTKGKTTTACLLYDIFEKAGLKAAMIGTMGAYIDGKHTELINTTPNEKILAELFASAIECDTKYLIMEVSSQGLKQNRVKGIEFDYGIFTNLSRDHISSREHASMEEYVYYKSTLFSVCKTAILNADDSYAPYMREKAKGGVYCYGTGKSDINESLFIQCSEIDYIRTPGCVGVEFDVSGAYDGRIRLLRLGGFNIYNCLAAMSLAALEHIDYGIITDVLSSFGVAGRSEGYYMKNGALVIIDYAHNAASMESILRAVKHYDFSRIITVFGCGGNRSRDRRYDMGFISGKYADISVITSDNSRYEETDKIIQDIEKGILKTSGKYVIIPDRRSAMEYAISLAGGNDIVLLLGKGHEKYQEINGVRYPFDESEIIKSIIGKEN